MAAPVEVDPSATYRLVRRRAALAAGGRGQGRRARAPDAAGLAPALPPPTLPARTPPGHRYPPQEFDGASRRNPGRAGYGFVLLRDDTNALVGGLAALSVGAAGGGRLAPDNASSMAVRRGSWPPSPHAAPPPSARPSQTQVLTGCGALPYGTTNNEAEYCGLLYGLQVGGSAGSGAAQGGGGSLRPAVWAAGGGRPALGTV
jgi:hypothetical protein